MTAGSVLRPRVQGHEYLWLESSSVTDTLEELTHLLSLSEIVLTLSGRVLAKVATRDRPVHEYQHVDTVHRHGRGVPGFTDFPQGVPGRPGCSARVPSQGQPGPAVPSQGHPVARTPVLVGGIFTIWPCTHPTLPVRTLHRHLGTPPGHPVRLTVQVVTALDLRVLARARLYRVLTRTRLGPD